MASIADNLISLAASKTDLADNLVSMGVAATNAESMAALVGKVLAISGGVDTSDATAAAADILAGKTAYGSAGTKLTGTGAAYALIQELKNGNFASTTDWANASSATLSAASNILTITGNGGSSAPRTIQTTAIPVVSGKKIYVKAVLQVTNTICASIRVSMYGSTTGGTQQDVRQTTPTQNTEYQLSDVLTVPADAAGFVVAQIGSWYASAAEANGKVCLVKYALFIDLTTAFGSGNEPSKAQMDDFIAPLTNDWIERAIAVFK